MEKKERKENTQQQKMNVHNRFIYNNQKLETSQHPTSTHPG